MNRTGGKKILMNSTYINVWKVGIKRFWPQEDEMSRTAIRSLVSVTRKFFMNATHNMSKNLQSTVFWLRRPK